MLAAAGIVVVIAVLLSMPARDLTAGATVGDLRFTPSAPARGATITATYTPSQVLAGETRLRLRASYRTANNLPVPSSVRRIVASTLIRSRDGRFHGTFQLPESVVYATCAVETEDGQMVDSNARRLWPMLVSDSSGTPVYEALEQQVSDLMFRNWELALDAAKRAAALYPMKVRAQAILATLEQSILTPVALDSALATHRTLRLAAARGWDTETFHRIGDAALLGGDTATARDMFARIMADPSSPPAFADSARALLAIGGDEWSRAVGKATTELRSRMIQLAERRQLPESVTLTKSDGMPVNLQALVASGPTLVVFWSRGCGNALAITSRLASLTQRWIARGYGVILVVNDRPSSELSAYLEQHHLSLPIYRDTRHEARRALGQWGTPEMFVLDGHGRLRYAHTTLELTGAQLASLH
jgi:hypothetical protein